MTTFACFFIVFVRPQKPFTSQSAAVARFCVAAARLSRPPVAINSFHGHFEKMMDTSSATIELSNSNLLHCFLRIEHPLGMEISCRRGQAWITQEGDTRDYVLKAGESLRFTRSGTVLVSSLGPCTCAVHERDGQPVLLSVERRDSKGD